MNIYVGSSYTYLVPWLCLLAIPMLASHDNAISSLIFASNNLKPLAIGSIAASLTGLIVTWFTIPNFHVGGVVIGQFAFAFILQGFNYIYYWPHILKINSKKVFVKCFSPYILISTIAMGVAYATPSLYNDWANLFLKGSEFCLIYILLCMMTFTRNDFSYFRRSLLSR